MVRVASVCAGAGSHNGWWPLVVSRGVMACRLPWGLGDLLGPWSPVYRGVSLGAQGPRDGPDVKGSYCGDIGWDAVEGRGPPDS